MNRIKYYILPFIAIIIFSCNANKKTANQASDTETTRFLLDSLVTILITDMKMHDNVGPRCNDENIKIAEKKLGIKFPYSFKYFLKEFGNGAGSLYHVDQPVLGINTKYSNLTWLDKSHKSLGEEIETDGFGTFKTNTLLCTMIDNSNGGAWCWMTTENTDSGEWPMSFYNMNDQKFYYKVENFIEWLKIATYCKGEVIRELDKQYRLGLG